MTGTDGGWATGWHRETTDRDVGSANCAASAGGAGDAGDANGATDAGGAADARVAGRHSRRASRRRVLKTLALGSAGVLGTAGSVGSPGANGVASAQSDPVLLQRDFEDLSPGDWQIDESQWNGLNPWSVDTTYVDVVETADGDTVLDTQYPANQAGNGNGGVDMMVPLGQHYDELYHGYRVKFGEGFEFSNAGGKLPGLIGTNDTYAVTGGDDPDGTNGWSARMMWRDPAEANLDRGGVVLFYVYHPDQPGEYGENMLWDDGPSGQVYFERGTWHEVEHRIVMNTPGENDGILEGWFDGEKAFERRDLRFWDIDGVGINKFYVSAFFGGENTQKWAHSRDEHIYYDDFWISREPIWNGGGTGTATEPPTDTATPTPTDAATETPTSTPRSRCDHPTAPAWSDGTTPADVDGDGVYEDLNGNCEFDSDDVVTYFQEIDRDGIQNDPSYYDANGNGNADFDDVVTLFQQL